MNVLNRVIINIKKNIGKSILLFLLIFILGILVSGTISIQRAVNLTDESLRRNMPAVVTLLHDENISWSEDGGTDGNPIFETLSAERINNIGAIPYVEFHDFSISGIVYNRGLERYHRVGTEEPFEHWMSRFLENGPRDGFESFPLRGVFQTEFLDMRTSVMEIIEGRMFTEEEINGADPLNSVALISQELADLNQLYVGDVISLESLLFDLRTLEELIADIPRFETIFFSETFTLEIVGIYKLNLPDDVMMLERTQFYSAVERRDHEINHRYNLIYVPHIVVEHSNEILFEQDVQRMIGAGWADLIPNFTYHEAMFADILRYDNLVFLLHDPMLIDNFEIAAHPYLPYGWEVVNLSSRFAEIASSIENMRWLAGNVLGVTIGASVLVLTLLILLFIRDRNQEIGIYLALGEKRKIIIVQILSEVMLLGVVSIALSLFVGNILANGISQAIIYNETSQLIADRVNEPQVIVTGSSGNTATIGLLHTQPGTFHHIHSLQWFSPGRMELDEMMEFYDVSMDGIVIAQFYLVGMGVILISTVLPVFYITKLNPKKILMESNIGKSGS